MPLRAIWLISSDELSNPKRIFFSKIFATVEHRCKKVQKEQYVQLPATHSICAILSLTLGINRAQNRPDTSNPSVGDSAPVYEASTEHGTLWPLVVLKADGYFLCCLPLVSQKVDADHADAEYMFAVASGLSFMYTLREFCVTLGPVTSQDTSKVSSLHLFVSQACPFGSPLNTVADDVCKSLLYKPEVHPPAVKQPAWRLQMQKSKGVVQLVISETIHCTMYGSQILSKLCTVSGAVSCHADLDGMTPELTFNLINPMEPVSQSSTAFLQHISTHPCVKHIEKDLAAKGTGALRVTCLPPPGTVDLIKYTIHGRSSPIDCHYEVKGDGETTEFYLRITTPSSLKQPFDLLMAELPFNMRGHLIKYNCQQSIGTVTVSNSTSFSTQLLWNIGQKFSKSMEASIQGTIHFAPLSTDFDDNEMRRQNTYAKLTFRTAQQSWSGCSINAQSVLVTPTQRIKVTAGAEYESGDVRVWNAMGGSYIASVAELPLPDHL